MTQPTTIDLPFASIREVAPDLPIHPAAAEMGRDMTPQELNDLKKDISEHGQREPALVFQGQVIDGRCRQQACRELGKPLIVREWDGNGSVHAVIDTLNFFRRHLSASQRAMDGAKRKEQLAAEAQMRMHAGKAADPLAKMPQGSSRDLASQEVNVSPRMVDAAEKVRRKGTPELNQAVINGHVKVSAAAKVADLPAAEQNQLLRGSKALRDRLRAQRQKTRRPVASGDPPDFAGAVMHAGLGELGRTVSQLADDLMKMAKETSLDMGAVRTVADRLRQLTMALDQLAASAQTPKALPATVAPITIDFAAPAPKKDARPARPARRATSKR